MAVAGSSAALGSFLTVKVMVTMPATGMSTPLILKPLEPALPALAVSKEPVVASPST